jgi:serine/threonine protein kinase
VKLLDFGLAITGHDAALTMAGFVLGSLHYMSPEQINGRKVDGRSDLYSLGATFYELLTGKAPIQGDTSYAIMAGHLHAQPVKPTEINPEIPEELSQVVIKALAKNPDDRFQNAREFLQALEATSQEKTELLRLTQVYHVNVNPDAGSGSSASVVPVAATPPPSRTTVPIPRPSSARPNTQAQSTYAPTHAQATVPQAAPQRASVTAASAPVSDKTPSAHTPAVLEKIAKELAVYIGPIAKIVVQKTAGRCGTVDELYKALAEEIDSSKDREKFVATRRTIKA